MKIIILLEKGETIKSENPMNDALLVDVAHLIINHEGGIEKNRYDVSQRFHQMVAIAHTALNEILK